MITGRIYKIFRPCDENTVYIGSTKKPLNERLAYHRYAYKQYLNGRTISRTTSCEIVKYQDAEIHLLELVEVNDNTELRMLENDYINEYRKEGFDVVNKYNAFTSEDDKIKHSKEYKKKYSEEHKEQIKQRGKQYREPRKEEINKRVKEYNKSHKEEKRIYDEEYRENNKEKIKEKMNKKFQCKCGGKYTRAHKLKHERTQIHINYVLNNCNVTINNN